MEQLISIGVLVILIGFALVIAGSILTALKSQKARTEWSIVGLVGLFPIGFASSKKFLFIGLVITIIFLLLLMILKIGR